MITLPWVLDFLARHHLYLFRNITVRATLAALLAFVLSLLLGPVLIRWLRERQIQEQVEKKDSQRLTELHSVKKNTPTQGGILISGTMLVAILLFGRLSNPLVLIALAVLVGSTAIGFLDDVVKRRAGTRKGLTKGEKLSLQFALYAVICTAMQMTLDRDPVLSVPFLKHGFRLGPLAYVAWGAFVLSLASNAVNLTDGLDGLAAGCSVMTGLAFTVVVYVAGRTDFSKYLLIPYVPGCGELAVVGAALVGACLGFLWFNCHPAEVFMGDTGSLALGGMIGYLAFASRQEFVLMVLGSVFLAEVASVVLQVASFRLLGRRIFKIAPIHHHFEFSGWHESKVTVRFWILAAILAMAMILTLKLR